MSSFYHTSPLQCVTETRVETCVETSIPPSCARVTDSLACIAQQALGVDEVAPGKVLNPESLGLGLPEPKLKAWFPDNETFWANEGSFIAWRNIMVSMFNLLLGFAVWIMWSVITTKIKVAHSKDKTAYPFTDVYGREMTTPEYNEALSLIPSIAGIAGGTFRICHSFCKCPCHFSTEQACCGMLRSDGSLPLLLSCTSQCALAFVNCAA